MMRVFYSMVGILMTPLLHFWLRRRAMRGKEISARLGERFGHASIARPAGKLVWLHAASVGEMQSVLTLLRALLQHNDSIHVLITTGTVTSAQRVAAQQLPRTIHQFIPVDTYFAVKRFLMHWRPDLVLWVESEFWPQLLWQMQALPIPALLINARISEKTARNWARWHRTIRSLLFAFRAIYAGSPEDAARLRSLGVRDVRDVGNLKYDAAPLAVDETAFQTIRNAVGDRPVWVVASTHDDEEMRIAKIHAALRQEFPSLLTIIVPRHAVRGDEIAAALRGDPLKIVQRSTGEVVAAETDIYLADTMGELGIFYRLAEVVFIGGSLVPHGGHNPLEAAQLGCAIIIGSHTHNFSDIVAQMQAAHAIKTVDSDAELQTTVAMLLRSKEARELLAQHAQNFVQSASGASAAILQQILEMMGDA